MILRIDGEGKYIKADPEGIDYLIQGLLQLRYSEPGTTMSSPLIIDGDDPAVGSFDLILFNPNEEEGSE